MRKYFGTDGIRGKVGQSIITPDFVLRLGYAAGKVLAKQAEKEGVLGHPTVLIGKDTRISGYMLEAALEAGFSAAGVDVMLSGPMPTPAIAYLTRALRLSAGVVISASHNPYHDNGIKFFSAFGSKLPDHIELEIEAMLDQPIGCNPSQSLGKAKRLDDAAGRYIEFCKSTVPSDLDLRGMTIVVDCAHGATYHIAPHVLHELGANVIPIGNKPDGLNINDGVGATHLETLERSVRANKADLGIALDGDGDRLMMIDRHGKTYDGDELLYILVKDRLLRGVTPNMLGGVVGTLMSNFGLEKAITQLGLPFIRSKVGDRYVLEQLQANQWALGAENSGHILCLDRHSTGDGMVSALQVLAALKQHQQTLASMTKDLIMYPQKMINVRIERVGDWEHHPAFLETKAAALVALGEHGRLLIRKSGTEPLLRIMVEAEQAELANHWAQKLANSLS